MRWPRATERTLRAIGLALGALGLLAIAWYLADALRNGRLVLDRVDPVPLMAAMVLFLLGHAAHATVWHRLLAGDGRPARWSDDAARWGVSLLGKYLPGKVFHALGRVYLYRHQADEGTVTAAFAAEFVLSMSACAVAAIIGLANAPVALPAPVRMLLWAGAAAGVVATFTSLPDRVVGWMAARLLRREVPRLATGRVRFAAFAISLVAFVLMGAGLMMLAQAFAPQPPVLLPAYVAAFCLAGLAGVLAVFVPAGLGVRDLAMAWLLTSIMPAPMAASVALLARAGLTLADSSVIALGMMTLRARGIARSTGNGV